MAGMRVLIVDDHEGFLAAAKALLTASGFEVVGSVLDGESSVAAVRSHRPDVVVVDIQLPGMDGVQVAHRLAALDDPPEVILVSSREDAGTEPRVLAAPTRGFIAKRDLTAEAVAALLR
jgi:DNA-binding NarL/FixJ family response regulator